MQSIPRPIAALPIAAAALLVLAGCTAPGTDPTDEPSPSPSTTPTPGPASTPLFGGDCDLVADPAELASILGSSASLDPMLDGVGAPDFALAGGIACTRAFGQQGAADSAYVTIEILPAAAAEPGEVTVGAEADCDPGPDLLTSNRGCLLVAESGDWLYRVQLTAFGTAAAQQAAIGPTAALVEAAVEGVTTPEPVPALPEVDCADIVVAGTAMSGTRPVPDTGAGPLAAVAARLAGPTVCGLTAADGTNWSLTIWPGAAYPFDRCSRTAPGAALGGPAQVAGTTAAYVGPVVSGSSVLCVTDGTSSVELWSPWGDGWNESGLDRASEFVVPALAAASA